MDRDEHGLPRIGPKTIGPATDLRPINAVGKTFIGIGSETIPPRQRARPLRRAPLRPPLTRQERLRRRVLRAVDRPLLRLDAWRERHGIGPDHSLCD